MSAAHSHRQPVAPRDEAVTLRLAGPRDHEALVRLAGLDSAAVPGGEVLLALVDGEPRAALALPDRGIVADPFRPTAHLVELLRLRRIQLQRAGRRRPRLWSALRAAGMRASGHLPSRAAGWRAYPGRARSLSGPGHR